MDFILNDPRTVRYIITGFLKEKGRKVLKERKLKLLEGNLNSDIRIMQLRVRRINQSL